MTNRTQKTQYDCAATGQMHYRTFDGKILKFVGGKCEYILTTDCLADKTVPYCDLSKSNFMVKVRNTRCINSYEAHTCKDVHVEMKVPDGRKAIITLMQEHVKVELGDFKVTFSKGSYPQPLTPVIDGLEIFKVGIVTIKVYCFYSLKGHDFHNFVYSVFR